MTDSESLPSGWELAPLGTLAAPFKGAITDGPFGSNLKSAHYTEAGPRVIRLQNIGDGVFHSADAHISEAHYATLTKHAVEPEDVLIAILGETLPRACLAPPGISPAIVKADCIRFRADRTAVLPKYVCFALNAEQTRRRAKSIVHGVGRPRLSLGELRELPIPVAPRDAQQAIVDAIDVNFSRIDAGVVALERVQANLKRYRASVLKAACEGRLVPTEAELARRESRDYEPASVLLQRILKDRRRLWEEAELAKLKAKGKPPSDNRWKARYREPEAAAVGLPLLPQGWCWATVGQLATVGTGATPKRGNAAYYQDGTIPWVTSAVVNAEEVTAPTELVTEAALRETNLTVYPPGTLLVAMYGEGKTRGRVTELKIPATTNQALAALQFSGEALGCHGFTRLRLESHYQDLRRVASGGVQPNLNLELVRAIVVPLPPLREQARIHTEVARRLSFVDGVAQSVEANLARARQLRQSILQAAFAGQLPRSPAASAPFVQRDRPTGARTLTAIRSPLATASPIDA